MHVSSFEPLKSQVAGFMEQAEYWRVQLGTGLLFSQHCLPEGSSSLPDIVEIPKLFGHFQL